MSRVASAIVPHSQSATLKDASNRESSYPRRLYDTQESNKYPRPSSLVTIEEEDEYSADSVIPDTDSCSINNITREWRDAGLSLMKANQYGMRNPLSKPGMSISKYQVYDGNDEDTLASVEPSKLNLYKCNHKLSEQYDDDSYNPLVNFVYQDCCMKQTCADCPKKRYYAQILPPYKENRHRHHCSEKHCDKPYGYTPDISPYKEDHQYATNTYLNITTVQKLISCTTTNKLDARTNEALIHQRKLHCPAVQQSSYDAHDPTGDMLPLGLWPILSKLRRDLLTQPS
ncbi:hypothetical protein Trydic_g14857 [Trypoxylus dichotomus]